MSLLLDTNVLSELRKGPRCDPNVLRWIEAVVETELHTSVVVLGELSRGIERVRPRDPEFAASLERWLKRTMDAMGEGYCPSTGRSPWRGVGSRRPGPFRPSIASWRRPLWSTI